MGVVALPDEDLSMEVENLDIAHLAFDDLHTQSYPLFVTTLLKLVKLPRQHRECNAALSDLARTRRDG